MTEETRDLTHEAMLAVTAGLAVQANQLTEAAENLRETYRFSRTLRVVIAVGFVMMAGLIIIALQNRANGAAARDSTATIKACTTPGGDCFERGRSTTGEAVARIIAEVNAHTNLVFIATLECSHHHPRSDVRFEQCLRSKGIR